jgi:hypothetical protein
MRQNKSPNGFVGVRARLLIVSLLMSAATVMLHATPCSAASAQDIASSAEHSLALGTTSERDDAIRVRASESYGKLPLQFEANRGQTDPQVKFLSRGAGYTLFLTSTEAIMVFTSSEPRAARAEALKPTSKAEERKTVTPTVLRATLLGADPESRMVGQDELPGKANYFIGSDPTRSRSDVPTYARVHYQDLYPGIDLVYYGNQRQLEYDFVVGAGADPKRIVLGFQGVDRLEVDPQGDLVLHTAAGAIRQRKPVIYQELDGVRKEIQGGYVFTDKHQVGFWVAAYDATRPLVIDPVLSYSTYLGGSDGGEEGRGLTVDASGNAFVTGETNAIDFPTVNPLQPALSGSTDVFVSKLNPSGSALVYSTYIGGAGQDVGRSIAVDASGNAYVTGATQSTDFPTVSPIQPALLGPEDAFIVKLDPTGSVMVYSTYLGGGSGDGSDAGFDVAVDLAGNAYVTGQTSSTDFPTVNPLQSTFGGFQDAFVAKINPAGTALVYSTYLGGGSGQDSGFGIAVDSAGNGYITGFTTSTDFPTVNPLQPALSGTGDVFVSKLNPSGSALVYSTYIGGSNFQFGNSIAVDASGNSYVTGTTLATDFPTTPGAFQPTFGGPVGGSDAFVIKLNPTGAGFVYSTYLGGGGEDGSAGIAVDSTGNAYVTGQTLSTDFPTTPGAFQPTFGGPGGAGDAFVTKLNPTGSGLVYSTYLGGGSVDSSDNGNDIAVDSSGNAYIAGQTSSTDFPTTAGAFQTTGNSSRAFVAKIGPFNTPAGTSVSVPAGNDVIVTFTAVVSPGDTGATTSSTGHTPPAGFTLGTPPIYYDVTTTATFAPPVSVCITYDPSQFGDPSSLRLFHFENDAWMDATTSNDTTNNVICGEVNSLSPFVVAQPAGNTSLGPANIWVGLANSDDVGIRFDLRAEVYRNGTQLVGSGEVASVAGGSSGFNNAKQDTIPLTVVGGVTFQSGDTVSIKLYVRNACSGSGKNSGRARLWYNDSVANSRFDATIGNPRTYFLRNAFVLATTPGPGLKKTIDVAAGAKCSAYKSFGTWSITNP